MFNFIKKLFSSAKVEPLVLKDEVKTKKPTTKVKRPTKKELSKLTKSSLEAMGREHGIELDKRLTKDKLVNQLHKQMGKQ